MVDLSDNFVGQDSPYSHNGVITWVPDTCGSIRATDANLADAKAFNPTTSSYYIDQLPSTIPGIVLGGISLLGFVLMITWIIVRCCRRRKLGKLSPAETQFLTSGSQAASAPLEPPLTRRKKASDILTGLMLLFAVATVGVAAWGMAESIKATDPTIPGFWSQVYTIRNLTQFALVQFQSISYGLVEMSDAADILSDKAQTVIPALKDMGALLNLTDPSLVDVVEGVEAASTTLRDTAQTINSTSVDILQNAIIGAIDDVLDLENPTMDISNTWRYVVFAVVFGLVILFVILATWACFYMRFGRWASLAVALVWLLNAIVCLIGIGLINGMQQVSQDACLYTETFLYRDVITKIGNNNTQRLINAGLDYYFERVNLEAGANATVNETLAFAQGSGLNDTVAGPLLNLLTCGASAPGPDGEVCAASSNVDLVAVLDRMKKVNETVGEALESDEFEALAAQLGLSSSSVAALRELGRGAILVLRSIVRLVLALLRINVTPIYHSIKTYICCTINDTLHNVWVPWTVTGALGLVYCLLASARVIWQTVVPEDRGWAGLGSKRQRQSMPHNPPPSLEPEMAPTGSISSGAELQYGGIQKGSTSSQGQALYNNPVKL